MRQMRQRLARLAHQHQLRFQRQKLKRLCDQWFQMREAQILNFLTRSQELQSKRSLS
jgi:hypothetical protein